MKALVRWGATLGLVGSTLLGTVFAGNAPVLALPEKQIQDKLNSVPVYVITNNEGIFLSYKLPEVQNGQKLGGAVTDVYLSPQQAQAFINQLRSTPNKDPKMAEIIKKLQVTPVPLGIIYQQLQQSKNQPNRLLFDFKPVDQDIKGAVELLRQSGQKVEQFRTVPIFVVRSAPDQGYIVRTNGKEEVIPLFFSKQDALGLLNQVKQKFPKADIQVLGVDNVIKTLQDKNDDWLKQVVLVPSQESIKYIQSLRNLPNNSAAGNNNPQPAKPKP